MRCFRRGLGLVTELAFVSVFAFPGYESEARLTSGQARSGHFLLYRMGSTYALTSAIIGLKELGLVARGGGVATRVMVRLYEPWNVVTRGNTVVELSYSRARLPGGQCLRNLEKESVLRRLKREFVTLRSRLRKVRAVVGVCNWKIV